MLADHDIAASLPAADIVRAKAWYRDMLDLKPTEEMSDGGALYDSGQTQFLVYPTQFAGTNQATAAAWRVPDVPGTVSELRGRGVVFEEYDFDEIKTVDGVLTTPDGTQGAWFKDSEGNILGLFSN